MQIPENIKAELQTPLSPYHFLATPKGGRLRLGGEDVLQTSAPEQVIGNWKILKIEKRSCKPRLVHYKFYAQAGH